MEVLLWAEEEQEALEELVVSVKVFLKEKERCVWGVSWKVEKREEGDKTSSLSYSQSWYLWQKKEDVVMAWYVEEGEKADA